MYPFVRTALTILRASRRARLGVDDTSTLVLRVGINDVDIFGELNNARHLNMMELGRWDYSQRLGFIALMRKQRWAVVVGGASIRYRRRLRFWQKYTLSSRILCHDSRWFYFLQETHRNNQICSSALVKAGVSASSGLIPAPEVLEALGVDANWCSHVPDWVVAWIDAEGQRPWPNDASN